MLFFTFTRESRGGIFLPLITSVCTLLMLSGKLSAEKTGSISGQIYAADTGQPLPRANVVLGSTSRFTAADISGSFLFGGLKPDSYRIYISHVGYASLEQGDDGDILPIVWDANYVTLMPGDSLVLTASFNYTESVMPTLRVTWWNDVVHA